MVKLSIWFVGFLNLCSLLLGIAAISYTLYLRVYGGSACQNSIPLPVQLITGLLLITVSLLGFVCSFWKLKSLLYAYLSVMLLLIIGFVIFSGFAIFIASQEDHSSGNYELKKNYSRWLEKHFVNHKNWNKIRSCLIDAKVCKKFDMNAAMAAAHSYSTYLSPIELGCCMLPYYCVVDKYTNVTVELPEIGDAAMQGGDKADCDRWSNNIGRRCYYCDSCKAGFVTEIKKEWRFVAIAGVVCAVVLLIIMFAAACNAKSNIDPPDHHSKPTETEAPLQKK
ncbi:hypothetical protein Ddye_002094 [Dipteronia dyeriana]|uniref:Tetraspanin n=1 Tax=Dipteronia dyeriana TaxID=168575 RepID=A0AAE0CU10_9ROSI|nr:hypothetical protein Ddye_002094 [Dipteronia dyeriana]